MIAWGVCSECRCQERGIAGGVGSDRCREERVIAVGVALLVATDGGKRE